MKVFWSWLLGIPRLIVKMILVVHQYGKFTTSGVVGYFLDITLKINVMIHNFSQSNNLDTAHPLPILNTAAPHAEHFPLVAGLPFFMVTCWASSISR